MRKSRFGFGFGGRFGRWVAPVVALVLLAAGLSASGTRRDVRPSVRVLPAALSRCGFGTGAAPAAGGAAVPDFQELVSAGEQAPHVVAFGAAKVVVPPGAVNKPTSIGVSNLLGAEVPKLDSGMSNVTGQSIAGFRFTPHPMRFAADVELTLPYDPSLLPSGLSVDDVYTFFFDEASKCWAPLKRTSVDDVRHTVTSVTNHFTDFINATVTAPESPDNVSFNPNQIKGIQAGDPGAGITVLAAPGANSQGTNDLGYPIAVPPGRLGVQPSLAVSYGSASGNGWLGVGWDLALPKITIDTRFGVPRYSSMQETETYLLGGQQLTPLADRAAPVARSGGDKIFHTRVEGGFERIVRHGNGPASYTWEVTDNAGTRFFYGALPGASGPDAGQTLSGGDVTGSGVFVWPLREVRDTHGNFMRFTYVKQADPGVPGGQDGVNLYAQTITYTGSGTEAGRYTVRFVRDRDLGEPLRVDKMIDARGGFKRVTADRLRRIEVTFRTDQNTQQLVRRYELTYTTGAFGKSLLASIGQTDDAGVMVGTHTFGYFDDVRTGGVYQGFADGVNWTVPGDSLANATLDAILTAGGGASVINANTTSTVGGHLFVGAGVGSPVSKTDKVGAKVGTSRTSNEGLVALVDVDGDGLPDKVFRTGDGIFYRKNLSGPNGQLAFSADRKQLGLPGISEESSRTWVWGIEGYPGSVAAQLDRVQVSATTSRYFADVNDDGITDLVDGSRVWFGRLGADGTPAYGLNDSAASGVPVNSRPIDTSVFGNLTPAPVQLTDANPPTDVLRRWIAPFDGNIAINAFVRLAAATTDQRAASKTADGVRVAIQLDGTELGALDLAPTDNTAHEVVPSTQSITVHRGDRLYFRVGSKNDGSLDQVDWDPVIGYLNLNLNAQNAVDENGLSTGTFHQAADFTLGGRATQVVAPLTGTLHLSGPVVKAHTTSDDVTVVLTRDGTAVFAQTIPAATSGSTAVSADVTVQQGQVLTWRLKIDSPVDLGALSWKPQADYTAASGVDRVVDDNGNPLISLFPPYDVDMYPDDGGLDRPRDPFLTGTADGDYSVRPLLSFQFGDAKPSGQVVFTVKRRDQLLGKRVIQITNGVVSSVAPIVVHEEFGPPNPQQDPTPDELFFDYSTRDASLRSFHPNPTVSVGFTPVDPESDPSTFDTGAPFRTPVAEGGFPQPYRGWAAIGYNAAGSRATAPVIESDLVVDQTYADQFPDSVDPQAQKDTFDADPHVDVPNALPFAPSPKDGQWRTGQEVWIAARGASSSRLGTDSVALPSGSDFTGAIAVPRISASTQTSLTGSVSVLGGSGANGDSFGQVDFLDLNGDGFPDVASGGGIQYTNPDGGLGTKHGTLPNGAVRSSSTSAGNAGIHASSTPNAGSPAQTTPAAPGLAAPTGPRSANTAHGGNTQQSFGGGAGAEIGFSDSNATFDLVDVNGDGLPDRVYADGQVRLNLGYSFAGPELWPSPTPTAPSGAPLNDGTGITTGANLGFNTTFYSFAGGVSVGQDHNGTAATLADVNGDGLPDRVFNTNPIKVGFNTGAGFATPVPFGTGVAQLDPSGSAIGSDQNTSAGGGAYATFGFCFADICVVFNPGADGSVGIGRSVQALRDINGDGYTDQLASTGDGQLTVAANTTGRTNLLESVTLPLGGQMHFDYTRDGNTQQRPQSRFVLSKLSVDDKRPGDGQDTMVSTFEYSGGVYDRAEREFDGYATVITRQRDAGNNDVVLRNHTAQFRTDGHYTRGLPTTSLTTDAAGHKFVEAQNTYTLVNVDAPTGTVDPHDAKATIFPQLTRTDQRFFEGQDTAGKTTFSAMEYDAVGNVTRSFTANEAGTGDDVDVRIGYTATDTACQTNHLTGVPKSIDVFGGGTLMRHRESDIDCATGNVTQVRAQLDDTHVAVTDMTYLDNGTLQSLTGPANKNGDHYRLDYGYDGEVGTYVTAVSDSFGFTSSSTYDPRFGAVLTSTDINGQRVTNTYDNAGRLDTVTSPYEQGSGHVSIDFDYHPEAAVPFAKTSHIDKQADGSYSSDTMDTITFVDGLDRVIQTKGDAAVSTGPNTTPVDVMIVSGRVDRDALGRAVKAFFPITEAKGSANTTLNPAFTATPFDAVAPTVTSFDVLDRVTTTVFPDSTTNALSYGFGADRAGNQMFETIATDVNGKTARTDTDVRGLTTTLKQSHSHDGVTDTIFTSYGYDPLGEKTSIVDDQNHTTSIGYDNLGRQTDVTTPDSGHTQVVYDLADNMVKKITAVLAAQNKEINYDYDFNRLKAIRYPIFSGNNVTYTYGGPGAADNGANRIIAMTDGAGTLTRRYGRLGEVTSETRQVPIQGQQTLTFTTGYEFDSFNRVLKLTYPDTEVLSYHYNSGGQVDTATGIKEGRAYTYLTRLDYDKFGQRVLVDTGTGTRTQYDYDSANRRLKTLKANLAQGATLGYQFQNLAYSYDNLGNITRIANNTAAPSSPDVGAQIGGPATETFAYDDLNRLVHAQGTYTPGSGNTDTYTQDMSYDSLSNITNKTQNHTIISNGQTTTDAKLTYNNTYHYPGSAPHAADTIGVFTFSYDADGNQIKRVQQSGPTRQMIWDEENRIACDHENLSNQTLPQNASSCDGTTQNPDVRYFYDDQGNRIVKDAANFHVYPNQNFSTDGNQQFKHIYIGPTKLLTKTREDGKREDLQFYSHGDNLGSTGFVTDATGKLAEHLQYIPGGETWVSENPVQPVPQQYTGKEQDPETGLYYYGARYYDPAFATWQSPDPALPANAADTTSLSAYLYANANPIKYTDPDGRDVHILVDTSGRDIDYAAVATRAYEIEHSPSFDPAKDAVYRLQALDLGKLEGQIDAVRADAAARGLGPTVEFSVWGHAGADGPIGAQPTSADAVDKNQMTIEGWNKIDFGWQKDASFAAFYGCRASAFAEKFFNAQKSKGLGKAGYFETASYPSLSATSYVRDRSGWGVDAIAEDIRKGKLTVSQNVGIWYIGISKWEHRANTWTGASVNVQPMRWVTPGQWWVPGSRPPTPAPVPPPTRPVPVRPGGVWI